MNKQRNFTLFILLIATTLATFSSCNHVRKRVVQNYPNGNPMLVYLEKGKKDAPVRVGERMYYENGQLQFEKRFSGCPETPDGTWSYFFDNGQLFASADFSKRHDFGSQWQFFNRNGGAYYDGKLDSVYVTDMGMFGTPSTVVFCSGRNKDVIQFYSNYTIRSTERLVDDVRSGRVYFYFPNGNMQVEANFVNGLCDGPYIVYHENGVPFQEGKYSQGKRVGTWEFYDENGELAHTKNFDTI